MRFSSIFKKIILNIFISKMAHAAVCEERYPADSEIINSSKIHKSVIYQTKETQTGTATIMVNGDTGDNVIAIYPGA
ncbi:hypothetical protein ONR49_25105, partial [Salmonella enterica subsp. enterica serovar Virginia]|nr:hypothetical protein [Salmonella enterica subsp. enterica serovar Virginia]